MSLDVAVRRPRSLGGGRRCPVGQPVFQVARRLAGRQPRCGL